MAGYAQLTATAAPGHTLAELEAAIFEEIARLAADGPTDEEIDRGRVQAEAQFMFRLQTVGGFGGKSDQLNAYNTFLGRPGVLRARPRALSGRHQRRRCRRWPPATSIRRTASRSASCRRARATLAAPDSELAVVS